MYILHYDKNNVEAHRTIWVLYYASIAMIINCDNLLVLLTLYEIANLLLERFICHHLSQVAFPINLDGTQLVCSDDATKIDTRCHSFITEDLKNFVLLIQSRVRTAVKCVH